MSSQKTKIENPALFIFMVFLFLLSVTLIGYGISKRTKVLVDKTIKSSEEISNEGGSGDGSLSKYFENSQQNQSVSGTDDYYLQNDPFRETCAPGEGGKTPFIVSGTVCYR